MQVKNTTIYDLREPTIIEGIDADSVDGFVSIRGGGADHFFYVWITEDQAAALAQTILSKIKKYEVAA